MRLLVQETDRKYHYQTMCLQVTPFSSWGTHRSLTSVIVAAKNGSINVHTIKAVPDSGIAYLALALRQQPSSVYEHYVPGCNGIGLSFFSVVSIYSDTSVLVNRFTNASPDLYRFLTLTVHTGA